MKKLDRKGIEDIIALTPMQEGILFHYLKNPGSELYFEQLCLDISGTIDNKRFEQAWNFVIENNDMLRTLYRWENVEKPIQIVLKEHKLQFKYYDCDLPGKDEKEKKTWIEELKVKDRKRKFDLREVPFRVTLCKFAENKYEMIVSNHHILYDGWSSGIILKEFFDAYNHSCVGNKLNKPAAFKEFVQWIRKDDTNTDKQEKFWKEYLKDFDTTSGFPLKRRKKKEMRETGNYQIKFPDEMRGKLAGFVKSHNITIASLLYSVWGLLLQRYHSSNDVLFDITVSGRSAKVKGIENIVGLFINTLPFRVQTHPGEKTAGFLSRIYHMLQRWGEFENSSLANINEYLDGFRQGNLFDSVVVIENYPLDRMLIQEKSPLSVNAFSISTMTHYDLTVIITPFEDIKVSITYNKKLFDEKSLLRLCDCFMGILDDILNHPGKKVSEAGLVPEEERDRLLAVLGGISDESERAGYEYTAPRNETEEKLAAIWSDLLRVDKSGIGIDTDFFDFGGHSLKATLLAAKMHRAFNVKVPLVEIFRHPTIRELAKYTMASAEDKYKYVSLNPAEKKEYYPLSSAQKRLFMLQQLEPESTVYNGPSLMLLEGGIDKNRIKNAFKELINRHESLRTSFPLLEGEPVQKIHKEVDFTIEEYKGIIENFVRPFDLLKAPLLRVGLTTIDIDEEKHLLMVDMHHIITDGTSTDILTRELAALYKGETLPPLRIQYKDFSEWQNEQLKTGKLKKQEKYWLEHLSGELPVLNMPTDYSRSLTQSFEGERLRFELEKELNEPLNELMRRTGTTLYMVLLAVYNILLSLYTGQEDIIVGTPIAGRNHEALEPVSGLFMETLAVRNQPSYHKTFRRFLKDVKDTTLKAYENQGYPFRELIKRVAGGSDLSRNPLFDAMLNILNQDRSELEMEGVKVIPCEFDPNVSKVDFTLEVREKDHRVLLELEYCTALFKRSTMKRFLEHFVNTLRAVVHQPGVRLSEVEIMSESEKRQILAEFNNTAYEYTRDKQVHELFQEQVEKKPDRIAVIAQSAERRAHSIEAAPKERHALCPMRCAITYKELNEKSNQLAALLIKKGVKPDTIVGIMEDRSPLLIIGIMGVLKSGGAYLPLDPTYPGARIEYMLKDSHTPLLVTTRALFKKIDFEKEIIYLENLKKTVTYNPQPNHDGAPSRSPGNLAYVIYTSGSTGKPKGVLVKHENLTAYLHSFAREFEINDEDVVIQQASYSFDTFAEEVFPCLLKGGCIVLPSRDEVKDTVLLSEFISKNKVSIIDCSPLLLNELNKWSSSSLEKVNPLGSIHTFISGGDILKGEYIDNLIKTGVVYNTYGPTEATICATYHRLNKNEEGPVIPIGKSISNYRVYILGRRDQLQPIGVPGELCISGHGVTRGYLNRPELTAEKFIHDHLNKSFLGGPGGRFFKKAPLAAGGRTYKTGDLARWLADGSLEFLGRMDHQVNIRGFRIELGEIESQLLSHEEIEEAAVAAVGDHSICAYFTANKEKTVRELRHFLSLKLPDYMIPAYFVRLERMPLTPGGKINTKALPEPAEYTLGMGVEYVPPKSKTEKELVTIWQELLAVGRVGVEDDFFELGGDSILVNRCIARVREELQVEIPFRKFFERPYIKALAEEIESLERRAMTIPRASGDGEIPLSFAQERLWFLQELDAENVAYFVPRIIRIKGELDIDLLEHTFAEIIRRHEILRTVFPTVDGRPVQRILPPYPFNIPVIDLSKEEEKNQNQKVSSFLAEEGQRPFDFKKGPLLRVTLLKLKEEEHLLVLTEHHLIHDGWTQGVLLREFITVFTAYSEGKAHGLPELPIQYADYAIWQRNYLQGEVLDRHLEYWKEKLSGLAPVLDLPADRPRPSVISGEGALKISRLSPTFSRDLKAFSRRNGATLFMTMLAVFKTLLYRYTGIEDLCIGTGIANRGYKEMEGMLGMVINTLSLRTRVDGDIIFSQCLHRIKETCLEAYQHEDTPFGKIVEIMNPERSLSYTPIFQVLFSFMDTPTENLRLPGLELRVEETHNRSSKFDINVVVVPPQENGGESNEEILVEWEYNTDIFDSQFIDRMIAHYTRLLEEIIHNSEQILCSLPILSDLEIHQLLYTFNRTASEYPKDKTIHQLFEEQAERRGDKIAVIAQSAERRAQSIEAAPKERCALCAMRCAITYKELNKNADGLAALLIEKGVAPGDIVGIMGKRSMEMVVGILGILKAGGSYLPIDVDYPKQRKQYMLADSSARVLVSGVREVSGREPACLFPEVIDLNKITEDSEFLPTHPLTPFHSPTQLSSESTAYIMYTSGSTGRPKGVVVTHRNVVRLVKNTNYVALGEGTRILQTGAPVFDATTFEIWGSLLNGGQLVLVDKEVILDAHRLGDALKEYDVNTLWLSSPLFNRLMQQNIELFSPLRYLLVGGDVLSPSHINRVKRKFPGLDIINGYGPTENTTFSTTYLIAKEFEQTIPIGSPIANSTAYIVDSHNRLQPIGVWGELIVGGDGVSRGYLNSPEMTVEKIDRKDLNKSFLGSPGGRFFKKAPLAAGGTPRLGAPIKLYKTGDLARWLPDGTIEFKGRMDQQVKIRGFRIELGEIENLLLTHGDIKEAVVIDRKSEEEKYLCAYIVPGSASTPTAGELRGYLSNTLPDYMIPSFFVPMDKIPLTPNGKIDRKSLPKPGAVDTGTTVGFTAPRDPIEEKLAEIWSEILMGKSSAPISIGIDDNFFDLGGHSLNAILLVARMHKVFDVKIPLVEFFKRGCIREVAGYIKEAVKETFIIIEPTEEKEYYPLSSAQKRLYVLHQMDETSIAYNVPSIQVLEGTVDKSRLEAVFGELIQRHESLRTSFQMVNKEPVQKIHKEVNFKIEDYFPVGVPEITGIIKSFIQPFNLSHAPLVRVGIMKTGKDRHILMVDMHHIITDATSMGLFVKEFMTLYAGKILSPLRLQYKDYSEWQRSQQEKGALETQAEYWQQQFRGEIPVLNMPLDYPESSAQQSDEGKTIRFTAKEELTAKLLELAAQTGTTIYMVLSAVCVILLSRYTGREDIVVGTPISGRRHNDLQNIMGMLVNLLAMRNRPEGDKTFREFLAEIKENALNAYENQDYQFEELVGKLALKVDTSRNPLVKVVFAEQQDIETPTREIPGLTLKPYPYERETSKFDLRFGARVINNTIAVSLTYSTALFKEETAQRITERYLEILEQVLEDHDIHLKDIKISHHLIQTEPVTLQEYREDFEF